jgi:hypothetical protein
MAKNPNCKSIYIPDDLLDWWTYTPDKSTIIVDYLRTITNSSLKQTGTNEIKRERVASVVYHNPPTQRLPQKAPRKVWHPNLQSAWDYYLEKTGHIRTLTEQRKTKLNARLNEVGPETLKRAMDYLLGSLFHNGENDRKWKWDIDFLIRNTEQVEKFADLYQDKPKKKTFAEMFDEQ